MQLEAWRMAKATLVSTHQKWIDTITQQCDQLKIGLKAYKHLSEGIELATELGIELEEAELLRTNPNTIGKSQESWPTPRANKVHPEITE